MINGSHIKIGKKIDELRIGEKLHLVETIEDKDLLLYLGLTNDNNPLYIQHEYEKQSPYEKPIVPTILLNGIVISAISKHLPGPGSYIREQNIVYLEPVYHYETIEFLLEIQDIDDEQNLVEIRVHALNKKHQQVMEGVFKIIPPQ